MPIADANVTAASQADLTFPKDAAAPVVVFSTFSLNSALFRPISSCVISFFLLNFYCTLWIASIQCPYSAAKEATSGDFSRDVFVDRVLINIFECPHSTVLISLSRFSS